MTAQAPDRLINKHRKVSTRRWLWPLGLYGIVRVPVYNHSGIPYKLNRMPDVENRTKQRSTGLYRGYIATFCLRRDGQLQLQSYSYPTGIREYDVETVNEILTGDFWIVLQRRFHDNWCRLIPFRDGFVVLDRKQWEERSWDWSEMTSERLSKEFQDAFKLAYEEYPQFTP